MMNLEELSTLTSRLESQSKGRTHFPAGVLCGVLPTLAHLRFTHEVRFSRLCK